MPKNNHRLPGGVKVSNYSEAARANSSLKKTVQELRDEVARMKKCQRDPSSDLEGEIRKAEGENKIIPPDSAKGTLLTK
ncbi:MAG: hypothetical protein WCG14_00125 [Chlamydiia bacterium]